MHTCLNSPATDFTSWSSSPTSQSLSTLSVIEDFLSKRPMPTGITSAESKSPNWIRNLNYYSEWWFSLCFALLKD